MLLSIGQTGFEEMLGAELRQAGYACTETGPRWVLCNGPENPSASGASPVLETCAFPHLSLLSPHEIKAESVNALAQALADHFLQILKGERVEAPWPLHLDGPAEHVGLGRRIKSVEKALNEILRKRLSRVAKLASPWPSRNSGLQRGLFVWFPDFQRCLVSREAFDHGQRRMADDDLAPSRSYLKVEEAYAVLGLEPKAGETVVDLGAAPGGWSFSAAKRGALVYAIDNGPMKGGALGHPMIQHRREDAFGFVPPEMKPCSWLFCDMVEDPHLVMRNILEPWFSRRLCRNYVINLKFGRVDPLALLAELRAPASPFSKYSSRWRVAHLFHDREEFTVVGELAS